MAEKDLKQYEEGIDGVLPKASEFDGLDLTPNELRLKKLEIEMNAHIDAKIMQNPDKMPTAVWFIIPNELGERFCYYGLTPILKNFLKYQLGYLAKVDANFMYHIFQGLCYYTPILGSIISDSYLDKFKTITILSSLYTFGFLLLTITSWPTIMGVETTHLSRVGPLLALLCICFGTGGIKPCVSAHGGDQFLDVQKYGLQKFYNYFYMAINTGALVASYASPAIQKKEFFTFPNDTLALWAAAHVQPTGNGYPQAFLMLTCFMACAVGVFVFGFKYYRVVPPKGTFILTDIFKTAFAYLGNRSKMSSEEAYKKTCETHTEGSVVEMMDLGKVIAAIWPAPIFWMAFNQNGTVWQDLGDQMAVPFGGDKVTSFFDSETVNNIWNPFFIIILAPIFANWLFPFIDKKFGAEKFGLMQRMIAGQFVAGLTFILAAIIQKNVNANCYDGAAIDICQSSTSIGWQVLMYFFITFSECLFSISGLNFTYIEVGKRTKSFCAALWLFTVGTGSFLTSALLEGTLGADNTTWTRETFFYLVAGLCFASAIVQYLISRWYVPKALRPTAHL
ncbi:PTR2-domain-containing protein [Rhizoclosmatium globosum]|uniref:PTR2-domain-containing protein n=1 Tax=Rhizoclosmatium globosum TaxID=329046 RepID=A0A1Y2BKA9_9FUNG|nr:hypothetical protein HDU79_007721 [Rhizoclosmatium sp. JEL0117]ORY35189.1 PTR2-domain-containing protein [Rhizoclosmatium globosum]|eukprot:ORY35189.1 PTR2-domain-containing protein [Rhizoclosmatium globosum]